MKTKRTQQNLDTLTPEAKEVISKLLEIGYKNGLNVQVHSAYRSPAEQDKLFSLGRTRPGKVVTNARGTPIPQSSHCYRVAVDTHFDIDKDGVAEWDMHLYKKLWDLAVEAGLDKKGLRWAGNWESFKEGPHFEVTHGKTWKDLAVESGYKIPGHVPMKSPEPEKPKPETPKVEAKVGIPETKKEEEPKQALEKKTKKPAKKKAENNAVADLLSIKK